MELSVFRDSAESHRDDRGIKNSIFSPEDPSHESDEERPDTQNVNVNRNGPACCREKPHEYGVDRKKLGQFGALAFLVITIGLAVVLVLYLADKPLTTTSSSPTPAVTATPPLSGPVTLDTILTIQGTFNNSLKDPSSPEYQALAKMVVASMNEAYGSGDVSTVYDRTEVVEFRDGSIISVLRSFFREALRGSGASPLDLNSILRDFVTLVKETVNKFINQPGCCNGLALGGFIVDSATIDPPPAVPATVPATVPPTTPPVLLPTVPPITAPTVPSTSSPTEGTRDLSTSPPIDPDSGSITETETTSQPPTAAPTTLPACNTSRTIAANFNTSMSIFSTPSSTGNSPENYCHWHITGPPNSFIMVHIYSMDIPRNTLLVILRGDSPTMELHVPTLFTSTVLFDLIPWILDLIPDGHHSPGHLVYAFHTINIFYKSMTSAFHLGLQAVHREDYTDCEAYPYAYLSEDRCDGVAQCPNEGDEVGCDCGVDEHVCANGICTGRSGVDCDGNVDCTDYSDEGMECNATYCVDIENGMCREVLPYNQTYFSNDLGLSQQQANDLIVEHGTQILNNCSEAQQVALCRSIYPACPRFSSERVCSSACKDALECAGLTGNSSLQCDVYPDQMLSSGEDNSCGFSDDDILRTGDCGTRPAAPPEQNPSSRIVGGEESGIASWPWMASYRYSGESHGCGATLISPLWAVTAAHCEGLDYLVFGSSTLNVSSSYPHIRRVAKAFPHPEYTSSNYNNDIMLLKLDSPVELSDTIRPACLATEDNEAEIYHTCHAVGWGRTAFEGSVSRVIKQSVHPIQPAEMCLNNTDVRYFLLVTHKQICAGYDEVKNSSICQGDSGGPLICRGANGRWKLVGITSTTINCGSDSTPSVFTRVSRFIDFIRYTIASDGRPTHSIHLAANESVNITSPSYPGSYPVSQDVTWVITTETGWVLQINTLSFDTDPGADIVRTGEGVDFTKESIWPWSGSIIPPAVHSTGNEMWISFTSDNYVSTPRKGFAATIKSIPQSEVSCSSDEFYCRNLFCINLRSKCDYRDDCPDGSDESDCGYPIVHYISPNETLSIVSPRYPKNYPSSIEVIWIVQTEMELNILIRFLSFSTEARYDYLEAGNGDDHTENRVFQWTGTSLPNGLLSTGNIIWLRFVSDSSVTYRGFSLTAASVPVKVPQIIFIGENETREVSSPPPTGANWGNTTWIVSTTEDRKLLMTLFPFNTVSGAGSIHVGDGADYKNSSSLFFTWTGSSSSSLPQLISDGNTVWITFQLDPASTPTSRYVLLINSVPSTATIESTSQTPTVPPTTTPDDPIVHIISPYESLSIVSLRYPDKYPSGIEVVWIILTEMNWKILISFSSFSTESCCDFFQAGNGDNHTENMFFRGSGQILPNDLLSTGNVMWLRFTSDGSVTYSGFSLTATSVPLTVHVPTFTPTTNPTFTPETTPEPVVFDFEVGTEPVAIISPGFPVGYSHNTNIALILRTNPDSKIQITCTAFHTEASFDIVFIGDGDNLHNESTRFFAWSGAKLPPNVLSEGHSLWMRFTSDATVSFGGFSCSAVGIPSSAQITCRSDQHDCGHSVCIIEEWVCDSVYDCLHGSEETNCDARQDIDLKAGETVTILPPANITSYSSRFWVVQTVQDRKIRINFTSFNNEALFLVIYAGDGKNIPAFSSLFFYSRWNKSPPDLLSNGNEVWIGITFGPVVNVDSIVINVTSVPSSETLTCASDEFNCGRHCVDDRWVCDADLDCLNGMDEVNCDYCSSNPCQNNGTCVPAAGPPTLESPVAYTCNCSGQFITGSNCETNLLREVVLRADETKTFTLNIPADFPALTLQWTFETENSWKIQLNLSATANAAAYLSIIAAGDGEVIFNNLFLYSSNHKTLPTGALSTGKSMWFVIVLNSSLSGDQSMYITATSVPSTEIVSCSADELSCDRYCLNGNLRCDSMYDCLNSMDELNCDYCSPNPCQNNGSCISFSSSYFCVCSSMYITGRNCESNSLQTVDLSATESVSLTLPTNLQEYSNAYWVIESNPDKKLLVSFANFSNADFFFAIQVGDGRDIQAPSSRFFNWYTAKPLPELLSTGNVMWLTLSSVTSAANRMIGITVRSVPSTENVTCSPDEFDCQRYCIPESWQCDKVVDCLAPIDELTCDGCSKNPCQNNGTCVPISSFYYCICDEAVVTGANCEYSTPVIVSLSPSETATIHLLPTTTNLASWVIQSAGTMKILIEFVNSSNGSDWGNVTAGDGSNPFNASTTFFSWSTNKPPPDLLSEGNAMWLSLSTNGQLSGQNQEGYVVTATSVPSTATLTCTAGELDCGRSVCIDGNSKCDGIYDCYSQFDEFRCFFPNY